MRVLVFGASLEYGAWDSQGGWVDRLKQHYHKQVIKTDGKKMVQVLNCGIGGDTSTKILKRLENEIMARQSKSWPFIFIFTAGTNDERTTDGIVETPIEKYEQNIEGIIKIAKKYTNKIIFKSLSPVAKPTILFKDQEYSNQRIEEYNNVLYKIVSKHNLIFVDVRKALLDRPELFWIDDLHPNDKGHELITNLVLPELEKLLS